MSTPVRFGNDEFDLELIPRGDTFIVTAPGVAKYLGFRDSTAMLRAVPEDEKGYTLVCTPGGDQRVSFLTEPGLYRVLGQRQSARIPDEAVREMVTRYQRWLFHDVLPAFRRGEIAKRGTTKPAELSRLELIEMARDAELGRIAAEKQAAELEATTVMQGKELESARPKAAYVDAFINPGEDVTTIGDFAKELGIREKDLREYLVQRKRIYKRVLPRRWSASKQREDVEYEWRYHAGFETWFTLREQPDAPRRHNGQIRMTLYVTPIGKERIRRMLETDPIGGAA